MRFLRRSKKTKELEVQREMQDASLETKLHDAEESKHTLDSIAEQTREIAEDITLKLRSDLIDKMRELELTAAIISDALLICAEDGTINSMNAAAEKLLQRSYVPEERICAQHHIQIDSIDYWDALIEKPETARVIRADGVTISCSINTARLDRLVGPPNYIMLLHVLVEEETIETAAIINKGTFIVHDGFITAVNGEIERVLQYPSEELLGMPFGTVVALKDQNFVDTHLGNNTVETSFDTVLVSKTGVNLFCKMAVSFVAISGPVTSAIVTIESIGEEIMDRKIDVIRCFGEDFFFRSSTYISNGDDMFMYLTPDLVIKYASESFKSQLMNHENDLTGIPLRDVLSPTEFKIAKLHFESLHFHDNERTISLHLKNTNSGSHQQWTDRAFFDQDGKLTEYRRSGTFTS
jgi:PAS domain-containing protein